MRDRENQAAEVDRIGASRAARRERRRERSRGEILDAARKVLFRNGVAATTLESVAEEAGMSKTGLYYYFPSKDALLFELAFASFEAQCAGGPRRGREDDGWRRSLAGGHQRDGQSLCFEPRRLPPRLSVRTGRRRRGRPLERRTIRPYPPAERVLVRGRGQEIAADASVLRARRRSNHA